MKEKEKKKGRSDKGFAILQAAMDYKTIYIQPTQSMPKKESGKGETRRICWAAKKSVGSLCSLNFIVVAPHRRFVHERSRCDPWLLILSVRL